MVFCVGGAARIFLIPFPARAIKCLRKVSMEPEVLKKVHLKVHLKIHQKVSPGLRLTALLID